MVAEGWVKLHRQLLDSPKFQNEKLLKVWIWCMLKASHQTHEQQVGRQTITLEPGQFVFGRNASAEELKLKPSTAWDYMHLLESDSTINIKSNNKFSIVTVVNWELYQLAESNSDSKSDSKSDNKSTTNQQQIDTNKNVKNEKNVKKETVPKIKFAEFVSMTEDEHRKLIEKYGLKDTARMIEILDNYKGSKGKTYKSDYRAILNWVVGRLEEEKEKAKKRPGHQPPASSVPI
jgi:hypothetical protein